MCASTLAQHRSIKTRVLAEQQGSARLMLFCYESVLPEVARCKQCNAKHMEEKCVSGTLRNFVRTPGLGAMKNVGSRQARKRQVGNGPPATRVAYEYFIRYDDGLGATENRRKKTLFLFVGCGAEFTEPGSSVLRSATGVSPTSACLCWLDQVTQKVPGFVSRTQVVTLHVCSRSHQAFWQC